MASSTQFEQGKFSSHYEKVKDGVTMVEHGNKGRKSVVSKTAECITWLQFFVNCIGDHQPDNGGIHLPSCFSKSDVYKKKPWKKTNLSTNQPTNHITISLLQSVSGTSTLAMSLFQIVQSTFQSPLTSSVHIFIA